MPSRRQFLRLLGATGAAGLALAAGAGCSRGTEDPDAFPVIRFGQEQCVHCGMIIDDPRFAAASREPAKASRHFDDIGCMVDDAAGRPVPDTTRFFVHDFETETWLHAAETTYVISAEIRSPMASGIAAVATVEAARRLAEQHGGQTRDWPALRGLAGAAHGRGHGT